MRWTGLILAFALLVLSPVVLAEQPRAQAGLDGPNPMAYIRKVCTQWRVVSETEFCSDEYELSCMQGDYSCLDLMKETLRERTCKIYECRSIWGDDCHLVETRVEARVTHAGCCNICVMRSSPLVSLGRVRRGESDPLRPCDSGPGPLSEGGW